MEGKLDAGAGDRLEAHIDACARCYHVLVGFARHRERSAGAKLTRSTTHGRRLTALQALRPLSAGSRVGRFVVLRWLGQGASGVVYAATDEELDRTVALKLTPPVSVEDGEHVRARVLAEARAMGKAAHPHVVTVHEVGAFESRLFIAMELVDGTTLRDWLGEERRRSEDILRVFLEAGRGLFAAHRVGIVHRDFKPSNVLVGTDGSARVTDFGLAELLSETAAALPGRSARVIAGTPAYMSPEQARGEPTDARSDQFSFCVALSAALGKETGSRRVRRAIDRGMRRDRAERWPSMVELLAALDRRRPGARSRWWQAGSVAAVALVIASLAVAYRENRTARAMRGCHATGATMSRVWNDERAESVRRAFLATGDPYAVDGFRVVKRSLDGYLADWTVQSEQVCEATVVRHEETGASFGLRSACLDDALAGMARVVDVFASADAVVVSHAPAAVRALPPVSACADAHALAERGTPPSNPVIAAEVRAVNDRIASTRLAYEVGQYVAAVELGREALAAAQHTGYRPQIAEALFTLASAQHQQGDVVAATDGMYAAAWMADAAGDDRLRAQIWNQLLFFVGTTAGKAEAASEARQQATSALERIGGDARLEAELHSYEGAALAFAGKPQEGRVEMVRSLDTYASLRSTGEADTVRDRLDEAGARLLLAQLDGFDGQPAAEADELTKNIEELEPIVGKTHLDVIIPYVLRADAHLSNLDFQAAADDGAHARAVLEAANGENGFLWALAATLEGDARLEMGDAERSVVLATGAVAALERLQGRDGDLGDAYRVLGLAYAACGDGERARSELELSLAHPHAGIAVLNACTKAALAELLASSGGDLRRARSLADDALAAYAAGAHDPLRLRDGARLAAWRATHR